LTAVFDGQGQMTRVGLSLVAIAAALSLATPATAQEIRLLLLVPRSSDLVVRVQVDKLEKAITQARGQLVLVDSLSDADVIVEFTGYSRREGVGGELECRWTGRFKALVPADPGVTERFVLSRRGPKATDVDEAAAMLTDVLAKALRRQGQRTGSKDRASRRTSG